MAVTTTKVLRLSFTTTGGKAYNITVANPKAGLDTAAIQEVMQMAIDKDIFITTSGALTGIRDIKVIDTSVNDLYDPLSS